MALVEIGFKPTSIGTSASATLSDTRTLALGDYSAFDSSIPPNILVAAGMTLVKIVASGRATTNGVLGTGEYGAYITNEAGTTHTAKAFDGVLISTDVGGVAWYESAEVNLDLSAIAGQWIKPAVGPDNSLWRRGLISSVTGGMVAINADFPDPFGEGGVQNSAYPMYMVINVPESGPSVNPTGTDVDLTVGTPAQIVIQSMGGATATALTLRYTAGELVVNTVQADFDYTANDADTGTISFTPTVGNLPYGSTGYQYVITLSAGGPVLSSVTSLAPQSPRQYVVVADPVSGPANIIYQVVSGTITNGDQLDSADTLLRANATFYRNTPVPSGVQSVQVGYWSAEEGVRYSVTALVSYGADGEGSVITARQITLRGTTLRNITMSGLS